MSHAWEKLLQEIERLRQAGLLEISSDGGKLKILNAPPTKTEGLYWILTNHSLDTLRQCKNAKNRCAKDISRLACLHGGLTHTLTQPPTGSDAFYVVYNGSSSDLPGRIRDHFNGGEGKGSLSILRSGLCDLAHRQVSYVTWEILRQSLPEREVELCTCGEVERIWRLRYGWPILCEK